MFAQNQEKVDFDKCVFPNCNNGKHNNFTLFGLPKKSDRQKLWLSTIDNPLLMKYSASYMTKAGVCKNHFTTDSFVDPERKILRRFANPVNLKHHAMVLKLTTGDCTKQILSSKIVNVDNHNNIQSFTRSDAKAIDLAKIINVASQVTCTKKILSSEIVNVDNHNYIQSFTRSDANAIDLRKINVASRVVSPVKKISFTDENRSLNILKNNNRIKDDGSTDFKRDEDNMNLIVNKPHRVYTNNRKSMNNNKTLMVSKKVQTDVPPHSIIVDKESNDKLKQEVAALRKENIRFRIELIKFEQTKKKKMELSQKVTQLNKVTKRQADRITKLKEKISSLGDNLELDNYLNFYNDLTPVAKTMVKLQLHKPKAPYSEEQKTLAMSIFVQSPKVYSRLCEAGINLPSISSVKNWISEPGNNVKVID